MLNYHYGSINVAEMNPEDVLATGEPALLPLLPLTKGGATRPMSETMLTGLKSAGRMELIMLGGHFASLAFGKENATDQEWLTRKVHSMFDILQDTPLYQTLTKEAREEGLEKGREQGLQQGLQQGKLANLREILLTIVQVRFPKLARLTKGLAAVTEDTQVLHNLILKMSQAQTFEEAQAALLEVGEEASQ